MSYTTGIRVLEEGLLSAGVAVDVFSEVPAAAAEGSRSAATGRGRSSVSGAGAPPPVQFRKADVGPEEVASAWSQLARLLRAAGDNEVRCAHRARCKLR